MKTVKKSLKNAHPRKTGQGSLRVSDAKEFLAKYREAWETHNAELAASLFTRDARYKEGPFGEPIVSREAIHDYWKAATQQREDAHLTVNNFFRIGYILVAEWSCTYRDRASGERKELAGMFLADFYGKQVRTFRAYSLSRSL